MKKPFVTAVVALLSTFALSAHAKHAPDPKAHSAVVKKAHPAKHGGQVHLVSSKSRCTELPHKSNAHSHAHLHKTKTHKKVVRT